MADILAMLLLAFATPSLCPIVREFMGRSAAALLVWLVIAALLCAELTVILKAVIALIRWVA